MNVSFSGRYQKSSSGGFPAKSEFLQTVIKIRRVVKVTKGGRTFRFSALVVVGNKKGKVGYAVGKAREIPLAIQKAARRAEKTVVQVPIINTTVPHAILGYFGASKVLIKPANPGVGLITGGAARVVVELAGYENIYTKSLGSNTPNNLIAATVIGLQKMKVTPGFLLKDNPPS